MFKVANFHSFLFFLFAAWRGKNKGEAFENIADCKQSTQHSAIIFHDRLLAV